METHYNNPNIPKDLESLHMGPIVDNSGLKLYYTQSLRKHDAGILSVGKIKYIIFSFLFVYVCVCVQCTFCTYINNLQLETLKWVVIRF